jgi:hypothetical protein
MTFAVAHPDQSESKAERSCVSFARTPTLVIPAHAGIHFDLALAGHYSKSNQAKIKSFRSLLRSLRVTFLCLSKEKITKRKDTPAPRPPGILPSGFASAKRGSSTAHPVPMTNSRASMHATLRAIPLRRRRCAGAPSSAILADRARMAVHVVCVCRLVSSWTPSWRPITANVFVPPYRHPRERGGPVTLVRRSRWVPACARTTFRLRVSTALSSLLPGQVWTATRGVPQ